MQDELSKLKLKKSEKTLLPLGYSEIFVKKVFPEAIECKLVLHSKKYNKINIGPTISEKPVSKIFLRKQR